VRALVDCSEEGLSLKSNCCYRYSRRLPLYTVVKKRFKKVVAIKVAFGRLICQIVDTPSDNESKLQGSVIEKD